ncbi:MAG TPA: NADH-quinone oxidoreductase subunit N [Phototrophicaceae bacterium]|nr:NADH-quinone oxidoreductase subunit N [Phototrophicaceae bacterium]
MTPSFADLNLGVALPGILLALWAVVLLLIDLFVKQKERVGWLAIAGIVVVFVIDVLTYNNNQTAFLGMFIADPFSSFMNLVILFTAAISILLSMDYVKRAGMERGEYYVLLLFTTVGGMFMASANDLIAVFVSLELLSIPLYVLAAFRAPNVKSEESGMKYFILGAFSSAFFVYGAALIYGATGTTNLPQIFAQIGSAIAGQGQGTLLLLLGSGLILVGLGFKVAVVPFHMWTPDVYEGAPTPITAFMSVAAKVGGFAALLRIMIVALPALQVGASTFAAWQNVIELIAAATLILGNFVALSQTNVKRLLAYSSIANAGYILMAVAAAGSPGIGDQSARAALIYLLGYMFTNLGAFAVVIAIEKDDGTGTNLDDFKGLSKSRPTLAALMAIFMLSLIGIPLTGGFIGKWFVFWAALNGGLTVLAVIGVLTSVVSAFYYARVIVNMYLADGEGEPAVGETNRVNWAVYIAAAGTILIGIAPFVVTALSDRVALLAAIVH